MADYCVYNCRKQPYSINDIIYAIFLINMMLISNFRLYKPAVWPLGRNFTHFGYLNTLYISRK